MNPSRFVDKAHASLHFLRVPTASEQSIEAQCLNCPSGLILHQPDLNRPERLLGICESCKHWFLIDLASDEKQGVMVMLPDMEGILEVSHQNRSAEISMMGGQSEEGPATPGPTEPTESRP